MPRKKKADTDIYDEPEFDEDEEDFNNDEEVESDEDFNIEEDAGIPDFEEVPENPMGLAYQISKESDTIKHFKELPREARFAFFDVEEKRDIKHFARTYRNWKYIEKIIELRKMEDEKRREVRKELIMIKTPQDFKDYLKNSGRDYLINDVEDIEEEDMKNLLLHISKLKHNYFLDCVENKKDEVTKLYDDYHETQNMPEYIDDMGNVAKVMDTSIASMGFKGNAAQHSVMTINAVKNEDVQKQAEEKSRFSFMDAIKKKLG